MKRLIKFRAWCRQDNMMYCDIQNGITFDDHSVYTFNDFLDRDDYDYHEWEIMQFTGLHDQVNSEIYEGDLIRCDPFNQGMEAIVEIPPMIPEYFHWFSELNEMMDMKNKCGIQVVGDIYRNPKLISK